MGRAGRLKRAAELGCDAMDADSSNERARYWLWLTSKKMGGYPSSRPRRLPHGSFLKQPDMKNRSSPLPTSPRASGSTKLPAVAASPSSITITMAILTSPSEPRTAAAVFITTTAMAPSPMSPSVRASINPSTLSRFSPPTTTTMALSTSTSPASASSSAKATYYATMAMAPSPTSPKKPA